VVVAKVDLEAAVSTDDPGQLLNVGLSHSGGAEDHGCCEPETGTKPSEIGKERSELCTPAIIGCSRRFANNEMGDVVGEVGKVEDVRKPGDPVLVRENVLMIKMRYGKASKRG
jgi:hypothetical protein